MTRARRLTAALVVAASVLSGCGLPTRTDPKYVGPAPTARPAQDRAEQQPLTPGGAVDLAVLVTRYLATSVGGNVTSADQPDAVSETQARMKTFMTEKAQQQAQLQWQVPPANAKTLTVVKVSLDKVSQDGGGGSSLQAEFTPVNTLNRDGMLTPPQTEPFKFEFKGEQVGDQLLLSEVPAGMLLSTEGLRDWYDPQPVYFWEKDVEAPKLVPDLRYMPTVLSASKRVGEVMLWLANGPSELLGTVVERLPSEIETTDNPSLEADRSVKVNLSSKARGKKPEDLRKVARQIRWSLAGHPPVTLTIENAKDDGYGSAGFENDNAAVVTGGFDQEKFVVIDSKVRPADIPSGGPTPLFAAGELNTKVVSAAINQARSKAALVRNVNGKPQLLVSAADATATNPPKYVEVPIPSTATSFSRPAWISRPLQRFLIADGRNLYAVTPPANPGDQPKVDVVQGPTDIDDTRISAFAVSPDGRRIALVVGNTTKVAALKIENGRLRLAVPRDVPNTLGPNKAVGWFTETSLVIGGQADPGPPASGRYSLIATSVDGTGETLLPINGPESMRSYIITQMSVRTNDPLSASQQTFILFESNGTGQVVYNANPGPIQLSPTDQPSSPPASRAAEPLTKSPFYAD